MECIEGIDYIFDRYAYLGIGSDSDIRTIQRSIGLRRAECHSDLLAPMQGQKFMTDLLEATKKDFAGRRNLLDQCEEVLTNGDARKIFDEKLAEFKRDNPKLVSDDGRPIISIHKERIAIGQLLSGEESVGLEIERKFLGDFTKFSQANLQELERRFSETPDDPFIKKLLKEELGRKLEWAVASEALAWSAAGIDNKKDGRSLVMVTTTGEITEETSSAIDNYADNVIPGLAHQSMALLALGSSVRPLLLTWQNSVSSSETPENALEIAEKISLRASGEFKKRASGIREAAAEKEKVIQRLSQLVDYELFPATLPTRETHFAIVRADATVLIVLQLEKSANIVPSPLQSVMARMNWEEMKQLLPELGVNIVKINQLDSLRDTPFLELAAAIGQLYGDDEKPPFPAPAPSPC